MNDRTIERRVQYSWTLIAVQGGVSILSGSLTMVGINDGKVGSV